MFSGCLPGSITLFCILEDKRSMRLVLAVFLCAVMSLPACTVKDEHELELLVHEDPEFRNLIEIRDQIDSHVDMLRHELSEKRSDLNKKIAVLRKEYGIEKDAKEEKIYGLRMKLRTIREEYEVEVQDLKNVLEMKETLRSQLASTLKDAIDLIEQKEKLGLSEEELSQWNSQVEHIQSRLEPLLEEIKMLQAKVAIRSKKLKYL